MRLARAVAFVFAILAAGIINANPLTLQDALRLADEMARLNKVATIEAERYKFERYAAWSNIGPKLNVTYDYQHWNEAITFTFDLPPELQQYFPQGISGGVIRPQDTFTLGITVVQPLTTLYQVFLGASIAGLQWDMKRIAETMQRRQTKVQVAETFFGVLETQGRLRSLEAILVAAKAHLEQVEKFYAQGLLKQDDLLQVKVRVAQVEQAITLTKVRAEVLCGQLNVYIGRESTTPCELIDDEQAILEIPATPDECLTELRSRPDLRQAKIAIEMARKSRLLKAGDWLPQVSGLFNYSRTKATEFARPQAWFVGISLTWNPWEWGRTYFEFRSASKQLESAKQALLLAEEMASLEVKSRWLEVMAAKENLEKSEASVAHARENLRIQRERAAQNMNTTRDVLDAEALLLQAEADRLQAYYGLRVALYKLWFAMGR